LNKYVCFDIDFKKGYFLRFSKLMNISFHVQWVEQEAGVGEGRAWQDAGCERVERRSGFKRFKKKNSSESTEEAQHEAQRSIRQ